jgi:uncharacterized protein with NRDE domain
MCLIVFGWKAHPEYPLIVAANRDEFHGRPAAAAAFWPDKPSILAGRDLEAKGTWMGVSRSGRFAAVTNYRGGTEPRAAESRGALVTRFLESDASPASYMLSVQQKKDLYSGFNLLVCDGEEFWSMSNRDGPPRGLEPGIYGLGNTLLEAPEVAEPKARFTAELGPAVEPLFSVLAKSKIVNERYGTRCSTVLLISGNGKIRYAERSFAPDGADQDTLHYEF